MTPLPPTLSYCVVNTNGREDLLACLEAIDRFQELIDDIDNQVPGNPAEACPTQACRNRAKTSLAHVRQRKRV